MWVSVRLANVLAIALLAASCGGGVPTSLSEEAAPPVQQPTEEPTEEQPLESTLEWEDCDDRFECSTLTVPVDHGDPDGPTLDLALIRLPAPPAAKRIGSLVLNPGGPGASGVDFVRYGAVDTIPAELRAKFDVVGFDPRGVGASSGIDCGGQAAQAFAESMATSSDDVAAVLAAARGMAEACAANGGPILPHVSTDQVAADLDLLREALGDHRLTYVGYSYGTLIGALYADRYPDRVRALVLDGAVDPSLDIPTRARDKAATTERALAEFFDWCAAEVHCPIGDDPAAVFEAVIEGLAARPLPTQLGGELRYGAAVYVTWALLTDRGDGWPYLAAALGAAAEGDGTYLYAPFESMSGAQAQEEVDGLELSALLAVNCLDVPAPNEDVYPRLVADLQEISPLFGSLAVVGWAPCTYWPAPAVGQSAPINAPDSPPLVVIGTVNDAITPYSWSQQLADQLTNATLFTRDGDSHTAFGGGNVCTDRAVMGYLLHGRLPADGATCG
jgi:pimeloyl-ACP methyl ester carboxylesterase